jgi:hypothetical protein
MPRMCTVVTLSSPELGSLRVMTTHLEYYSSRSAWRRLGRAPFTSRRASRRPPLRSPTHVGRPSSLLHTPQAILRRLQHGDVRPAYDEIQQPHRPRFARRRHT